MHNFKQKRFDAAMFRAALAYYGLPTDYPRFFTRGGSLRRFEERQSFLTTETRWYYSDAPSYPERDSLAGRLVWVQVNLPEPYYPLKKAEVQDIVIYQNFTLDFEWPSDPTVALRIGLELAQHILDLGLAQPHNDWLLNRKPGLPVEYSGAGVHICLPIPPLKTASIGGPEVVNDAVRNLVRRYIQPRFDQLCAQANLNRSIRLEGYDIGMLLSFPGTWRPPYLKKDDCEALGFGMLRRWHRDDEELERSIYPRRRESAVLAELIMEECERILG